MSSGRFTVHGTTLRPSACASAMRLLGQVAHARAPRSARPPPPRRAAPSRRSPPDPDRPTKSAQPSGGRTGQPGQADIRPRCGASWRGPRQSNDCTMIRPRPLQRRRPRPPLRPSRRHPSARPGCSGNVFSSMLKRHQRIDRAAPRPASGCARRRAAPGPDTRPHRRCPGGSARHRSQPVPPRGASGSAAPARRAMRRPGPGDVGVEPRVVRDHHDVIGRHAHVEFERIHADRQRSGEAGQRVLGNRPRAPRWPCSSILRIIAIA